MFCPRCGDAMALVGPTYTCVRGDMELSRVLHDRLSEVFVARTRHAEPRSVPSSGAWFCPGCGKPTTVEDGHVRCTACDEYLDEFMFELIEKHPHLTRLLLTVEDTFDIPGRGLVLAPFLPAEEARPRPFPVELHRPDGTVLWVDALVQVPFNHPTPTEPKANMILPTTAKTDVPVGTKVWVRH